MQPSACGKRYVRVPKTVAGVTHDYIVDGTTILAEITPDYTLRFIYDENGSPIGFVYTPTGSASATYYYEKNLFGDVIAIWEDTGSSLVKVGTYAFNAYGQNVKVTNLTGGTYTNIATLNPFRYRSYYYDADLYLYHLQSRYFDPVSCRFISADGQLNGGNTILGYNMYAYCGNDPINRIDTTGNAWETVFDIVSLAFSIAEVVSTPTNPMAWVGLAGDALDLIPFVTGVGEIARVANIGIDAVDTAKDLYKSAKTADKLAEAAIDIEKATGSYEILYKSGKNYVGKGGFKRAITSAIEHAKPNKLKDGLGDEVVAIRWKYAPDSRQAFVDEFAMQLKRGVGNDSTYNQIWSPGRKYFYDKFIVH